MRAMLVTMLLAGAAAGAAADADETPAAETWSPAAVSRFAGLRALVVEPEHFWGWDAAVFGALHQRGFDLTYAGREALEDLDRLSQYDLVASNIRRQFGPAVAANLETFVAAGGALYASWGGPMGDPGFLRDVCRVAATRSVRIDGMTLLPGTPLAQGLDDLDVPFPTRIGHAVSRAWEIVSVQPLAGGTAVARDAAGNVLGVLARHGDGRTAVLGFGPEKEKQFVRREIGPVLMDNLLAWLLEDRLKEGPRRWSGIVEVALPARAEVLQVRLNGRPVADPAIPRFGSVQKIRLNVGDAGEADEVTIDVAYHPLPPGQHVETLIHLPWASLPRGGPPERLAEWLHRIHATRVQPLLREPNGHAYYRGMPDDAADPVSVTQYEGDFLADFIEACHARGIQVIGGLYFESRTTLRRHPEAALVEKNGTRNPHQACFNRPEGQEYNLATIEHLLKHYRLDGLILDDNYELQNYDCHCPVCEKGFRDYCARRGVRPGDAARDGWGAARHWQAYRREATRALAAKVAARAHRHGIPVGGWVGASKGSAHLGRVFDFLGGMVYTEPPRAARLMLSRLDECDFVTLLWAPGEPPERIQQEFREAVHAGSAVAGFWAFPPGHEGTADTTMLPGSREAIGRAFAEAEHEWFRFYRDNILSGDPRYVVVEGTVGRERLTLRVKNTGRRVARRVLSPLDLEGVRHVAP